MKKLNVILGASLLLMAKKLIYEKTKCNFGSITFVDGNLM